MTVIRVFRKEGHIVEVEIKGHSGYARAGKDIVCASVSAVTQGALLGLREVAGLKAESTEGDGYLKFQIEAVNTQSDAILETMYITLKDLESGYGRYIKMEDCKYVY